MRFWLCATTVGVSVFCFPDSAWAQACQSFVGQTVETVSFIEAFKGLPDFADKGEFETTADYQARRAAFQDTARKILVIEKALEDPKYVAYDADRGRFGISSFAFDNANADMWEALRDAKTAGTVNPSMLNNVDVVISSRDKQTGRYQGQNNFGVSATITKVHRTVEIIFDRPTDNVKDGAFPDLFPAAEGEQHFVGYIESPVEEAQRLKPQLRLAFVVVPKEPYKVVREYTWGKPTIDNPTDYTVQASTLIADIQCGLVLDGAGIVLGGYPTR